MSRKILFVDDEPRILKGLERMLFLLADQWEMSFVDSGAKALEALEAGTFDVIVSDMRMPEMDGATLLAKVKERYPNVVRLVLSGHAELETALRAVPVAHQFLTKPCDPDLLEEVIDRACHLQVILSDKNLLSEIGKVESLPVRPQIYSELLRALADPETNYDNVALIIEKDVAMCAKVLQLVNSSFFGLRRTITNIKQALTFLGISMIKHLVLSVEVFDAYQGKDNGSGFSLDAEQQHALLVANLAKALLQDKQKKEDAFMASMLHDVGKLVLAAHLPGHFSTVLAEVKKQQQPMHLVEKELYHVTHAEVGAYLLGIWGLPYPIIEAVSHHHEPRRVEQKHFDVLGAVYVANALVHELEDSLPDGDVPKSGELDLAYLSALGVDEELPKWRQMTEEMFKTSAS